METEQQLSNAQEEHIATRSAPLLAVDSPAATPSSLSNGSSFPDDAVVLGIDGGGTKTACVVMDARQSVLAQIRVGSCNRNSIGDEKAQEHLAQGIATALRVAGCESNQVAAACLGMAGIDRPMERALVSGWLDKLLPTVPTVIYNDAFIALASGTGGDLCGVAVISGTGMIVYGINRSGQTQRAGGWGPLFGDKGSGYAIGLAALTAVAHATDGLGPQTTLDGALRDYLDLSTPQALIPWAYSDLSWSRIADLAPLVTECAQQKDEVASRIIAEAAIDLAAAVEVVVRGLDMLSGPTPIVLSGGNLQPGLFSSLVHQHLNSLIPHAQLTRPTVEPAVGAALLAQRFLREEQAKRAE
jgi:N-acetylglucosamine kinase-like BadF-type ATPase